MLSNTLLSRDHYLDAMSLFFKNSFGMIDRMDTYYKQLLNIVEFEKGVFNRINIFSVDNGGAPNYFNINSDIVKNGTSTNVLDTIGDIFNIQRQLRLQYTVPTDDRAIASLLGVTAGVLQDETITLKNYEMLICIQLAIVENNYDGTYATLQQLYRYGFTDENGQVKKIYCAEDLRLRYEFATNASPLTCTTRLSTAPTLIQNGYQNIVKLFYAGKLTINSLGIIYTRTAFSNTYPGLFQSLSGSTLQPTALARFYSTTYKDYPTETVTVGAAASSYTITLSSIHADIITITLNGQILSTSDYTYTQLSKQIVINKAVSAGDIIIVKFWHCQTYTNATLTDNKLELSQYDTKEISKVIAGTSGSEAVVTNYTFDSDTGVITFGTSLAANSNIIVCCEPVYAVFM